MANDFVISNAAAQASLNAIVAALDAGTAAVWNIYSGTPPTDVDAALSGNTLLAQLTMNATSYGAATDLAPGARATANAITADSSADATGTATFYRQLTQNAGTPVTQGTVGTATSDLILNTTAITAGSQVSITSSTITQPEGVGRP
jgi:hypothetical protein